MNRLSGLLLAACLTMTFAACGSGDKNKDKGFSHSSAVLACDETVQNVIQEEIDVFNYVQDYHYTILPQYLSEADCIDSLINGQARIAVISRELTQAERTLVMRDKPKPTEKKILVDAIAIIVNPDNPVDFVSVDDLRAILSGEMTSWYKLVGGEDEPIQIVFDNQRSSTVKYMRDSILGGAGITDRAFAQKSNAEVFDIVSHNRNALGIIGVSWVSSDMSHTSAAVEERAKLLDRQEVTTNADFTTDVRVLPVQGPDDPVPYKPYQAYIYDGKYPLTRPMYMINTGINGTAAHKFFVFVTGTQGQNLLTTTGVMPAIYNKRLVELQ